MKREGLVKLARRLLEYAESETTATHEDGPRRNPITTYTDPQQFALEKERIFRRFPQLVCLGSDLAQPGDWLTHEDLGVPMLVVRGPSGRLRAFLNSCSHRGSHIAEGCGSGARSFVCPYHAWTYDLDGKLKSIPAANSFGAVDRAAHGLIELPCEERCGLVFVAPTPDAQFTADDHLGDLADELDGFGLAQAAFAHRGEWRLQTNWKLALDTFCESYHFATLHVDSVAHSQISNMALYDRFGKNGEHHRHGFPMKTIRDLADRPESEWGELLDHFALMHYIFPNNILVVSARTIELFRFYPGENVNEHVTRYHVYVREDNEENRKVAAFSFEYLYGVVDKEDYWISARVQRNFDAGIQKYTIFGRNEPALINMHRNFRRMTGLPRVDEPVDG